MAVHFELYATGIAAPEDTWAVVGDPRRLPEWTDVQRVERIDPEPVRVGTELVIVADGGSWTWRIVTVDMRLLEATTQLPDGQLGIGLRVARDPLGARLVVAGSYQPTGRLAAARVRLLTVPALRRRFDRWTHTALRIASARAPDT